MSERHLNEVTCDICGKKMIVEENTYPSNMHGRVIVNYDIFFENRERVFDNVCRECTDKIILYIGQLGDDAQSREGF